MAGKHLRAVEGEPAPDAWFATQAQALLTKALADKPTALVLVWETETHLKRGAVPMSELLIEGMLRALMETPEE